MRGGWGRYVATGCNKTAVLYEAETGKRLGMFSNEGVLDSQVALDNLTCGGSGGGGGGEGEGD